ncbi:hypothetical protein [Streptosporangium roseum]
MITARDAGRAAVETESSYLPGAVIHRPFLDSSTLSLVATVR